MNQSAAEEIRKKKPLAAVSASHTAPSGLQFWAIIVQPSSTETTDPNLAVQGMLWPSLYGCNAACNYEGPPSAVPN